MVLNKQLQQNISVGESFGLKLTLMEDANRPGQTEFL